MKSSVWVLLISGAFTLGDTARAQTDRSSQNTSPSFWTESQPIGRELPGDQFYPRGRIFPFSGFAGVPDRDKYTGYNLLGPVYVEPLKFLARAKALQIPVIYPIGIDKAELAKWESQPLPESEIRERITQQVLALSSEPAIAWWYLVPEELRYWRENEISYLRVACDAIRQADSLQRPIWTYEPNHREAESLVKTSAFTDIIGKGCYPNYSGYQQQRVWVRWSMEQQTAANTALGGSRTPILVPELFQDPEETERNRIREWVRHDVMLGLIHGAKGVVVYSLFERAEVKKSFDIYYHAYTEMARELLQNRKLGEVLLFGETRNDLVIRQTEGATTVTLVDPKNKVEAASLNEKEKGQHATKNYPTISSREIAYGKRRFLFLCNSSYDETVKVEITGFPRSTTLISEVLTFNSLHPQLNAGVLSDTIAGLGVRCYVFAELATSGQ